MSIETARDAGPTETGGEMAPDEAREMEKNGRSMALRISDLTMEGGTHPAVSGVWSCDGTDRLFAVTHLSAAEMTPDELLATFEWSLEGLTCH